MDISINRTFEEKIRMATEKDVKQILVIYKPFIEKTSITFEYEVPTAEDFTKRIKQVLSFHPWIVYEEDGQILGYAYATPYGSREAYQWSVTLSIYIAPEHQGKGIADYLYRVLLHLLKEQGIYKAYAIITLPNEKSERFHKKIGFNQIGIFENIGYKLGEWKSVGYFEYVLKVCESQPECPKAIHDILEGNNLQTYLKNSFKWITI